MFLFGTVLFTETLSSKSSRFAPSMNDSCRFVSMRIIFGFVSSCFSMIAASLYLSRESFSLLSPIAISTKITFAFRCMSRMHGVVSIENTACRIFPTDSKNTSNFIGLLKYFTTLYSTKAAIFSRGSVGPVRITGIFFAFGSVLFFSRRLYKSSSRPSFNSMIMRSGRRVMIFVYASRRGI